MIFKIIFSLTFILLTMIYTFFPSIKIDYMTVILILMIFVPWIIKYLKSFELSGIGKVEIITQKEKEALDIKVQKINILDTNDIKNKYINMEDPKLSLAALRIDIEEKLNKLADVNYLNDQSREIGRLSTLLYEKSLIDISEYMILKDIIGILNKAVHSQLNEYDIQSYKYIIEIGGKLIGSLDNKIKIYNKE